MKNKIYNFFKSILMFSLIFGICYLTVRMGNQKVTHTGYVILLLPTIVIFMGRHIIWRLAKPVLIIFTLMPFVSKTFEKFIIQEYNIMMHPIVKWMIIATIVTGLVGLIAWTSKLVKNMVFRFVQYCWKNTINFFYKIKLKIFTKRKEPCTIDLSMDQIDALGNGDTYLKGKLFEEFIANLYRTAGYNAKTTGELRAEGMLPETIQKRGGSGEQGVDVIVEIPQKNGSMKLLAIQCKHYSNKVENAAVQEITAALAMYKADQGCVITNNYFTGPAQDLARVNNVILIDRNALEGLVGRTVERYYKSEDLSTKIAKKEPKIEKVITLDNKFDEIEKQLEEQFNNKKTVFQEQMEDLKENKEKSNLQDSSESILPFKKKRKPVIVTNTVKDAAWKNIGA